MTDKAKPPESLTHQFEPGMAGRCTRYLGGDPAQTWAFCGEPEEAHAAPRPAPPEPSR